MTHVTCRLTAKNRDQLRNPTLGNRVWATFFTRMHSMRSRVYATVGRPSARLCVCPIRPLHAAAAGLLLWVRRAGNIDRLPQQQRANAGSAMLSAYVCSWTQSCSELYGVYISDAAAGFASCMGVQGITGNLGSRGRSGLLAIGIY